MKADFTRRTYRKRKHYRKVLMQQGRVQVDADWNEQLSIDQHYERVSLSDIIGDTGTKIDPLNPNGGFKVVQLSSGDIGIGRGKYYVDGLICENDSDLIVNDFLDVGSQPDLPAYPQNVFLIAFETLPQNPTDVINFILNKYGVSSPPFDSPAPSIQNLQAIQFTADSTSNPTKMSGKTSDGHTVVLTVSGSGSSITGVLSLDGKSTSDSFTLYSSQSGIHTLEVESKPTQLGLPGQSQITIPQLTTPGVVFLDVWNRHVTYLDDPYIADSALRGADTATREKLVWQVKELLGNYSSCQVGEQALDQLNPIVPGKLIARTRPSPPSSEPCELPPGAGYQGLQFQLYRVEVHDPGTLGTATFKWSRDNGSVVSNILGIQPIDSKHTKLIVSSTGRDTENLSFQENQWVEITDDVHELWGLPGVLVLLNGVDRATNTLQLDPSTASGWYQVNLLNFVTSVDDDGVVHYPKVRRWDNDPNSRAAIPTPNSPGTFVQLENNIEVCFGDAGAYFETGDYWLIRASPAISEIEWPNESTQIDFEQLPYKYSPLVSFLAAKLGIQWTLSGPPQLDPTNTIASFQMTDSSSNSHTFTLSLTKNELAAVLSMDGNRIFTFPVVVSEGGQVIAGDHLLVAIIPKSVEKMGIEHHYAGLAVIGSSASNLTSSGTSTVTESTVSFSISPETAEAVAGQTVGATITINELSGTYTENITLSRLSVPGGWTGALSMTNVTLVAGQTQTAQLDVQLPQNVNPGNYPISIQASYVDQQTGNAVSLTLSFTVVVPGISITDCRNFFTALTDLVDFYYAGGDGQVASPQGFLSAPLEAGVALLSTGVPVGGVSVQFSITTGGSGALSATPPDGMPLPTNVQSVTVQTDPNGIAKCYWILDGTIQAQRGLLFQQVEAVLLDEESPPQKIDSPSLFYDATVPTNFFYISGDGLQSAPGSTVAISAGLLIGTSPALPNASSKVKYAIQFSRTLGQGYFGGQLGQTSLKVNLGSPGDKGVATCSFTLDKTTKAQQVEATLLLSFDNGSSYEESNLQPIYFNIYLAAPSTASTTGVIAIPYVLIKENAVFGPYAHYLQNLTVEPAILLGIEAMSIGEKMVNPSPGGVPTLPMMLDNEYFNPFTVVDITETSFHLRVLIPGQTQNIFTGGSDAGTPALAPSAITIAQNITLYIRWWAVPANDTGSATSLYVAPSSTTPGTTVSLVGYFFAKSGGIKTVGLYQDQSLTNQLFTSTPTPVYPSTPSTTTDQNGMFACTVTIPSNAQAGTYWIKATDSSGNSASAAITIEIGPMKSTGFTSMPSALTDKLAAIQSIARADLALAETPRNIVANLQPSSGPTGSTTQFNASGLTPGDTMTLKSGDTPLRQVVVDNAGNISAPVKIPSNASGSHTIILQDASGSPVASGTFQISKSKAGRRSAGP